VFVTPKEPGAHDARHTFHEFDCARAIEGAAARTVLYPGDIVAGPASDPLEDLEAGAGVSIEIGGIGVLEQRVTG